MLFMPYLAKKPQMKTIIVSNRLPVKIIESEGNYELKQSEGGLATGLGSIYQKDNNIWLGWPGLEVTDEERQKDVTRDLKDMNLAPVFLTQDEINLYYEGFSNEVLWPVFHYHPTYAKYEQDYWNSYVEVNKKFRDALLEIAEPEDTIWIHDYQLLLLPGLLRQVQPDCTIGFFQHIPFPSYELFRLIPWRKELLEAMLGADLLGFHTFDDVRHFISAASRLLPVQAAANEITYQNRRIVVDPFPMGIDTPKYEALTHEPAVIDTIKMLKETFSDVRMILTIDRLDYSKGILQRLQAFDMLLNNHPEYIDKVVLYMIVVPSRDTVPQYRDLRAEIDQLVGNINSRYRTINWNPIHYYYRSFPIEMLSALYSMAEVCLVSPMRDGMNLVSKEYVASRKDETGVLILSEMAGASKELIDAILVNPNNIVEVTGAFIQALEMPLDEQKRRMLAMRKVVSKFNVHHWVKIYLDKLAEVKNMQQSMLTKHVSGLVRQHIEEEYSKAEGRIIFLDYDGTLVGFKGDINEASPDQELLDVLNKLIEDQRNKLVLVSGRSHETLDTWFKDQHIDIIAEHGAWQRKAGGEWAQLDGLYSKWKEQILPVMERYVDHTPGSFIEEKSFSLVWHYRKVEEGLGEQRANELASLLSFIAANSGLQILPGNKVVEIRDIEVNKGKLALRWLQQEPYTYIMAMGDDHTDEDMFKVLPEKAFTIKVGNSKSAARFFLRNTQEVRQFLKQLAGLKDQ